MSVMKQFVLLVVFVGFVLIAPTADAQSAPATAKADSPAAVLNSILSDAERAFVAVAEAMPASKFDFVPTGGDFKDARSFSGTIKHVIWANYLLAGKISGSNQPIDQKAIDSVTDRDRILQQLHESFAVVHKAIDTLTTGNMLDGGDGRAARLGSAAFVTAHTVAHCGELVEYLRISGIAPPQSWN
jgi:hypothetical protein